MQAAQAKVTPVLHQTVAAFRLMRRTIQPSVKIGFVPTMGALHDGHLSLVREARKHNDLVVTSIFVNPTQFGEGEDFDKYPRQLERDAERLAEYGVDHLFAPTIDDMYGKNHVTYVDPRGFDDITEGKARPGHFSGVATIVTKLFNIVQPTNAYFGQKDAAQCVLIKRIANDLDMDLNVVVMDTVREHDGFAMSSRNAYLKPEERAVAPIIHRSLRAAKALYETKGSVESSDLVTVVEQSLKSEPLVSEIQYISVDSKETMQPLSQVGKEGAIISLACKVGSVRLIDNIII
jgi:pantoate--beta-alanine ligase